MRDALGTAVTLLVDVPTAAADAAGLPADKRTAGTVVKLRSDDAQELVAAGLATFAATETHGGTLGQSRTTALTPTATKTAPYTAAAGELAVMNVPAGATTLTLPTSPADKAQVGFLAVGATSTAPLTVNRGGTDTIGPAGATSVTLVLANEVTIYQYQAAGTRWLPVANVKPQTALDGRFLKLADVPTPGTPTGDALRAAYAPSINTARLKGSQRIRAMAATPPGAPPLMTTPPTITQDTTLGTGLTATYVQDRLRWSGPLMSSPSVGGSMQPRGPWVPSASASYTARFGSIAFDFDGQKFDIYLRANATLRYRIWVNEQAATADLNLLPSGTAANAYLHVDLGSSSRGAPRRIVVEFEDNTSAISILNVRAAPVDLFTAPQTPSPRVLLVGDSFARGSNGVTRRAFSYTRTLARLLGWGDFWCESCGYEGTGLVHANDAGVGPYINRISYDVIPYNPDLVIVQGSVNDEDKAGLVGPALTTYLQTLRAALPAVPVLVTSPLVVATPTAASQQNNADMKAAAAALGVPYVDALTPTVFSGTSSAGHTAANDGPADWARASDYTHPTDAGAYALANYLAGLIGQALGLPV